MLVWLGVGVGRNNFWLLIEWSLVHHPKTCYHPICSLTLSKCMPPSRLWLHSSLLLSPPGNDPYSPLSLTGHWPFHDRLYFTPEFLLSTISLCKPTFLPLTLSYPCVHITLSTSFNHRPLNSHLSPCVYQAFIPFSPAWTLWSNISSILMAAPIQPHTFLSHPLTNHLISLLLCPHQWELWETKYITKHWNWNQQSWALSTTW